MKRVTKALLLAVLPLLAVATPVTSDQAARAVGTWIGLDARLGCRLGTAVAEARTCVPTNGVSFHVVKLAGGGFVVTSADTEIDPVLAFSESDDLIESEENPLWTLLRRDLTQRVSRRRQTHAATAAGAASAVRTAAEAKWARLLPVQVTNGLARAVHAATGKTTGLSDLRVAPLLETKWSQMQDAYDANKGNPCYNYYTPNKYPCGCVATAGAQIMRYHCFPSEAVTPETYPCAVSGTPLDLTMQGGVYAWSLMPTVPAVGTTEEQRRAIGKLTSDIGITCCMGYGPDGSTTIALMLAVSLVERFGYASAPVAIGDPFDVEEIRRALVSNLDAKLPVMLGIRNGTETVGHAVVADGYGYSLETFYAHVNMGWGGSNDAWYAPPDIGEYDAVNTVIYNIFPNREMKGQLSDYPTNGVICSGRILSSSGAPVRGTGVWARSEESGRSELVSTDEKGIYAFILPPGTYTISSGSVSSGTASRTVTLKANAGTLLKSEINNVIDNDLTVTDEPLFAVHTVAFDLGSLGMRTGGGKLTQSVIDGSSAIAPIFTVADGWKFTGWSSDFSKVTSDLIVLAQYEENGGGGGGGGGGSVTNAVKPGVWTTDVEGVKAAKDLRMAVVLYANYNECWWSQHEQLVFESPDFLSWAANNGVYLVTADATRVPEGCTDSREAFDWFMTLCPGFLSFYTTPTIVIAGPGDLDKAVAVDFVRSDGKSTIGGLYYNGTPEGLAVGLAVYLNRLDKLRTTLSAVSIEGEASVVSEETATYACVARFADGSEYLVDPKWEITAGADYASISEKGEFTATLPVTGGGRRLTSVIKATFSVGDVTKSATFKVTILPRTTEVSFDANGGAGAGASVTATYGATMPSVGTMPERPGYLFRGYFDAAEGGMAYYTETLASARAWDKKDATAVLYAQWKDKYFPSSWWADPVTGVEWVYESATNVVSVTNGVAITGVSQEDGVLLVPETVAERPVVALAGEVLANSGLVVVIVPANVVAIGANAFSNATALTRIDFEGLPPAGLSGAGIPSSTLVRYNDAYADEWETALTNGAPAIVNVRSYHPLPGDVWMWEDGVFGVCVTGVRDPEVLGGPVDVRIPQSLGGKFVVSVGANAFSNATTVVLPPTVLTLEREPFDRSPDLSSVDVIGGNPAFSSVDGVLYDCDVKTLYLCPQATPSIAIPPIVRRIADFGFLCCTNLSDVTLPEGLSEIGVRAFDGCPALELIFMGVPPSCGEDAVRFCRRGYYTGARAVWRSVLDGEGRWNGLAMDYLGTPDSGFVTFATNETSAAKGGAFVLTVRGGDDRAASSVRIAVTYGNARAADLVLAQGTVTSSNGVERTGLAFPLTLTWRSGDATPKTITIPVAAGKATDAPKHLTWNLTEPKGLDLGAETFCIGTVAAGGNWDGKDVFVMPYVADVTGGKVSGAAGVRPDRKGVYKAVTLKATANKGYWFAGWYDADGEWAGGDLSCKVLPDGGSALVRYEARFVEAMASLCATYDGTARVNLRGMTLVKGADTSRDVVGDYPMTVTLSTAGKISGAITVGGKKTSFAAGGCCVLPDGTGATNAPGEVRATFRCPIDEKAWFGRANGETLQLEIVRRIVDGEPVECGVARQTGVFGQGVYTPLADGTNAVAGRVTDKADVPRLLPYVGTYAVAFEVEGGILPLSVSVDKSGKVRATGRHVDGTALTMSGTLSCRTSSSADVSLFATPKSLGVGSLHVDLRFDSERSYGGGLADGECRVTHYTAASVAASNACGMAAGPYVEGCWHPVETDPNTCVVRLTSGDAVIDICYVAKNGVITGLASKTASGETVKFDAKTGLLVVTRTKAFTIQGILGDNRRGCFAAARNNADGSRQPVEVSFVELPPPEEFIPWTDEGFALMLGQKFGEVMQPSVTVDGRAVALTVSGLPAGLKYDAKTGLITGAPTRAGTFTVKLSYRYGPQTVVRTTSFVVSPKPADLPSGTYEGTATVRYHEGQPDERQATCPVTVTIDRNGALKGTVLVSGKKAFKAAGYDAYQAGCALYDNVMLDLSGLDIRWGQVAVALSVSASDLVGENAPPVADAPVVTVEAWRRK